MKKINLTAVMAAAVLSTAFFLAGCNKKAEGGNASNNTGELYVYNWGEYIDESVIEQFQKETGIKVIYDTFDTNEEMYPIISSGAAKYDVVCPSDYMIKKMADNDLLAEIDFSNVPNIKNIGQQYLDMSKAFDAENKLSVPYNWGTVGIIYNTSMVDGDPDSWEVLWDEKYKGNILMQDSVRDAFMVGEKKLGYSLNSKDKTELEAVRDQLIMQKPLVQAYVIDQVRDKMIAGEAGLAVIYSGEMLYIQNEVKASGKDWELKYVIPKEGSNLWLDSWVIPKNAPNKENAEKWIDFMCRADIAKKNFEYITYPTPNTAAFDLLDKELQENKAVFPDQELLKNCEVFEYLGEETDELYNNLWKEVKSN
jgi:extracellular solute-binding protein family 1